MKYSPAGFWYRTGANILDFLLLSAASLPLAFIIASDIPTQIASTLYLLFLPLLWSGYTVGKKAIRIQIRRVDEENLTFWTMCKRVIFGNMLYMAPIAVCTWLAMDAPLTEIKLPLLEHLSPEEVFYTVTELLEEIDPQVLLNFAGTMLIGFAISFVLLLASALMVGIRKDKRSIHDFIAGTYVAKMEE